MSVLIKTTFTDQKAFLLLSSLASSAGSDTLTSAKKAFLYFIDENVQYKQIARYGSKFLSPLRPGGSEIIIWIRIHKTTITYLMFFFKPINYDNKVFYSLLTSCSRVVGN